ncbi:MAG: hypothetical protein MSP08_11360 [Clostridiales bacterium]|nr:hypothetical protein [Clostridiales bacterium]MCI7704916.1 hypothetical protein [Clostridiales bacterium]MDY4541556.1 hypothetical protein [Candidatus Ventricola sp.]MDY4854973.1 hypothetical protein [Candidatus Ventricola sp.]
MTCTTDTRVRAIRSRTRQYRARCEARQLSILTACSLLLLAGIGLLLNHAQSSGVATVAGAYGAVLLQDGAGAYVVIGIAAFAAGVAVTVLCVRLKSRAARRMNEEDNGD